MTDREAVEAALKGYLSKEMPAGTEICDPLWWAARIAKVVATALSQPDPDPVAWITPDGEGFRMRLEPPVDDVPLGWKALYTAPPSKPWVSLTVEEIKEILYSLLEDDRTPMLTLIDVVQEKLKEKNGGV